jgi:MSHA biogenesis protein MshI
MRWPWQRGSSGQRLAVSWSAQTLAFVRVTGVGEDLRVLQSGVESQGADSQDDFVRRLQSLGLRGLSVTVMLRPEQYQLLQIEMPAVPPEELRSAARYQIKDMVDVHLDDLTIDVMRQGDGQGRAASQLFVIAARNSVVREAMELAAALQWDVAVVDVQDMAQRNLQTLAEPERASAALLVGDGPQALLTISAAGELYYSRRLELPAGFLTMAWSAAPSEALGPMDAYTPVEEYVPDYGGGAFGGVADGGGVTDIDRAQRVLVEVQRSIDLWDRTWASLPLAGLRVFAGPRSQELAEWLGREMGQNVGVLEFPASGQGVRDIAPDHLPHCLPLLGQLLRADGRGARS